MGFFSNMESINKIYKILASLEKNLADYVGNASSTNFIRNNGVYFIVKEQEIRNQLSLFSNLLDNGDRTIQYADFQFMGQKNRLANIIWGVTELLKQTNIQINLYKYLNGNIIIDIIFIIMFFKNKIILTEIFTIYFLSVII